MRRAAPAERAGGVGVVASLDATPTRQLAAVDGLQRARDAIVHAVEATLDVVHEGEVQEPARLAEEAQERRGLLKCAQKLCACLVGDGLLATPCARPR